MAFSYEEWKKRDANRRQQSTVSSMPSFSDWNAKRQSNRAALIQQSLGATTYDNYEEKQRAARYDAQAPKSDQARDTDARRFAAKYGSQAPKSEQARNADAQRFAGRYQSEQKRNDEKARQANADRFAARAQSETRKSEQAKNADADRFAGRYQSEQKRRDVAKENAAADRFAGRYAEDSQKKYETARKNAGRPDTTGLTARERQALERPDRPTSIKRPDEPTLRERQAEESRTARGLTKTDLSDWFRDRTDEMTQFLGNEDIDPNKPEPKFRDPASVITDVLRGALNKDNNNDRNFEKFGSNLRAGVGDLYEQAGQGIDYLFGAKETANTFKQRGEEIRKDYDDELYKGGTKEFSWENLLDPEYYSTSVARQTPQMASLVTGGVVGGLARGVASLTKLPKVAQTIIGVAGGAGAMTAMESAMEAGSVYDEAISRGMNREEAKAAADETFFKNLALTGGTSVVELGLGLTPLTRGLSKIGRVGEIGARAAGGAVSEGLQEGFQSKISTEALGDEFRWTDPSSIEAMVIGGLLGGTMTGGMSMLQGEGGVEPSRNQRTDEKGTPIEDAPKNPLEDIMDRTIQDLPDDVRTEFDNIIEQNTEKGMSYPDAKLEAFEWLNENNPDVEAKLADKTREFIEDRRREMDNARNNDVTLMERELNNPMEQSIVEQQQRNTTTMPNPMETPEYNMDLSALQQQPDNVPQPMSPPTRDVADGLINQQPLPVTPGDLGGINMFGQTPQMPQPPQVTPEQRQAVQEQAQQVIDQLESGDEVQLKGTKKDTTYTVVEDTGGPEIQVESQAGRTLTVPRSAVNKVLARRADSHVLADDYSNDDYGDGVDDVYTETTEMTREADLPPNFRNDIVAAVNEMVEEGGVTVEQAVEQLRGDDYYEDYQESFDKVVGEKFGIQQAPKIQTPKIETQIQNDVPSVSPSFKAEVKSSVESMIEDYGYTQEEAIQALQADDYYEDTQDELAVALDELYGEGKQSKQPVPEQKEPEPMAVTEWTPETETQTETPVSEQLKQEGMDIDDIQVGDELYLGNTNPMKVEVLEVNRKQNLIKVGANGRTNFVRPNSLSREPRVNETKEKSKVEQKDIIKVNAEKLMEEHIGNRLLNEALTRVLQATKAEEMKRWYAVAQSIIKNGGKDPVAEGQTYVVQETQRSSSSVTNRERIKSDLYVLDEYQDINELIMMNRDGDRIEFDRAEVEYMTKVSDTSLINRRFVDSKVTVKKAPNKVSNIYTITNGDKKTVISTEQYKNAKDLADDVAFRYRHLDRYVVAPLKVEGGELVLDSNNVMEVKIVDVSIQNGVSRYVVEDLTGEHKALFGANVTDEYVYDVPGKDNLRLKENSIHQADVESFKDTPQQAEEVKTTPEPKGKSKNEGVAYTESGTKIEFRYEVVEADDLIVSHDMDMNINTGYPQELQPRDRSREASRRQIEDIARKLNPELLGASAKASDGAPIVSDQMRPGRLVVESGNGRTLAVKLMYRRHDDNAMDYIGYLMDNAESFGLKEDDIAAMVRPVLVRIRKNEVDVKSFVTEANESNVSSMSDVEQAKVDADKLTPKIMYLFGPSENGDLNVSTNRAFIAQFLDTVVSKNDRPKLITADGNLSQTGLRRVQNAVFAKAYGNVEAVSLIAESTDNNIRNITNAMLQAAPSFAMMKESIAKGNLHDLDITENIVEAMTKLSELRAEGTTVETFLNQLTMFDDMSDISKELLKIYNHKDFKRSAKALNNLFRQYVSVLEAAGDPKQESLFKMEPPTMADILALAIKRVKVNDNIQIDIFETESQDTDETGTTNETKETQSETKASDEQDGTNELRIEPLAQTGKVSAVGDDIFYEIYKDQYSWLRSFKTQIKGTTPLGMADIVNGQISFSPDLNNYPPEDQVRILYHEVGHIVEKRLKYTELESHKHEWEAVSRIARPEVWEMVDYTRELIAQKKIKETAKTPVYARVNGEPVATEGGSGTYQQTVNYLENQAELFADAYSIYKTDREKAMELMPNTTAFLDKYVVDKQSYPFVFPQKGDKVRFNGTIEGITKVYNESNWGIISTINVDEAVVKYQGGKQLVLVDLSSIIVTDYDQSRVEYIGGPPVVDENAPPKGFLGAIDESRGFPTVHYKVMKTGIKAQFVSLETPGRFREDMELVFPFFKQGKEYLRELKLPKGVSVSDINDWLNIRFYPEGIMRDELIATFDHMNETNRKLEEGDVTGNAKPDTVRKDGGETLEGTPSEDVSPTETDRTTPSETGGRTGTDEGPGNAASGTGDADTRSEEPSTSRVDPAAERGGSTDTVTEEVEVETEPEVEIEIENTVNPVIDTGGNFRIKDGDIEGVESKKAIENNLKALETLAKIRAEGRPATPEEQKILIKYVGWGGIKRPFLPESKQSAEERRITEQIKQYVTDKEFESMKSTILNAHYTDPKVISAMYEGLQHLGFDGGRILEPSMGIGNFIGMIPDSLIGKVKVTGVELDPITGEIAKLLYPDSDIRVKGYEDVKIADDLYDVAIGNVPFGNYPVFDKHYHKLGMTQQIHNYFFAKTMDKVRPGGLVMFITSKGTMDSINKRVRQYLMSKGELVGAIRLPNTAFKGIAGTDVTTDIIILRKLKPGERAKNREWLETEDVEAGEPIQINDWQRSNKVVINEYFTKNKDMLLGVPETMKGQYGPEFSLRGKRGQKLDQDLIAAIKKLPGNIFEKRERSTSSKEEVVRVAIPAPEELKEGSFSIEGGTPYQKVGDELVPIKLTGKALDRLNGMIDLRTTLRKVFKAQLDGATEPKMKGLRHELNTRYDKFVKEFGPLNDPTNLKVFQEDPDVYLLTSIEDYDREKKKATKGEIFETNTVRRYEAPTSAESAEDALRISLNETSQVDIKRISGLIGKSEEDTLKELGERVYKTPSGQYETREAYLSGNVKQKLAEAETLAEIDKSYERNVAALKNIIPEDIKLEEIDIKLGSGWIPTEYVQEYVAELMDVQPGQLVVRYNQADATWTAEGYGYFSINNSFSFESKYGTPRVKNDKLLDLALNGKSVKVYDYSTNAFGDKVKTLNKKATIEAREKVNVIRDMFRDWLLKDEKRAETVKRLYNDTFNTTVLREYDGSHMTFPGMNPAIQLRQHQKDAVYRITQGGNTLLAHAVGAGKTFEMIAAMMELKRMGIVQKPMWTVPNHLVTQMANDFMLLYPTANILVPTKKDFQAANRKKLMARIATGNYDAVIVPHSSFGKISMSKESVEEFFMSQIEQLEVAIRLETETAKGKSKSASSLEQAKKTLEVNMKNQLAKLEKDDNVSFEELGVDSLFVDEAHMFKNLFFGTRRQNVGGLGNKTGSGQAFDMFMKVRYLQKLNGGKGVVFATGTPISNSMAEMYHMMRYLAYDVLQKLGMNNFDAWANNFADIQNVLELAPEGKGFRMKEKVKGFNNLPEVLTMFRDFSDVWTADELLKKGLIKRPKLKGGKREMIIIPSTPELSEFVEELAERAETVRAGRVDPTEDNMLKITNEGRLAALDMRLIDPSARDNSTFKVNVATEKIAKIWKDTKKQKGAQLVFLDLSTPTKEGNADDEGNFKFSVYNELRNKLIRQGIPAKEIEFIHDANTDAKKEALFAKVNKGEVRILIGSTSKMGAGTNVQKKLVALHHMDAPYRPSDIEQREGRILRQGNENEEVEIYNYATEGSFDAYMWQLIESKAKVIDQAMQGDLKVRKLEDNSDITLTANQVKALATGDVRIIDFENLKLQVEKLEYEKAAFEDQQRLFKRRVNFDIPALVSELRDSIARLTADNKKVTDLSGEKFVMTANGITTRDRKDAGKLLFTAIGKAKKGSQADLFNPKGVVVGEISGLPIKYRMVRDSEGTIEELFIAGQENYFANIGEETGTIRSLESKVAAIPTQLEKKTEKLATLEVEFEKLKKQQTGTFKKEEELAEKRRKRDELAEELNIEQDKEEVVLDDGNDTDGYSEPSSSSSRNTGGSKRPNNTDDDTDSFGGPKGQKRNSGKTYKGETTRDEILRYMIDNFQVRLDVGRFRQKAKGIYKNKFAIIRTKNYGDFEVLAHELGHRFDTKFGWFAVKEFKQEWVDFANANLQIPESYTNTQRAREGVAEYFRQYLYNETNANVDYRDLSDELHARIEADLKKAKWDKPLENLRDKMQDWLSRDGKQELRGVTSPIGRQRKPRMPAKKWVDMLYTNLFEKDHPIYTAMKMVEGETGRKLTGRDNAYELAVLTRGTVARAATFIQRETFDSVTGQKMGEGLEAILNDVDDIEEFGRYLVARHGLYLKREKGKSKTPLNPELMETYLKENSHYEETADRIYKYQRDLLQVLVDGGLIPKDLPDKLKKEYPYYVPFYRVMTETGENTETGGSGSGTSKYANQQSGLKRMSKDGSGRNIVNPIESIIRNTHLYMGLADRNAVGMALASLADPNSEYAAEVTRDIIEEIPERMQVFKVQVEELVGTLIDAGLDEDLIEDLDMETTFKRFKAMFRPNAEENEIVVWKDGKPKMFKIHDDLLYTALIAQDDRYTTSAITTLFKPVEWSNDMLRFGITASPYFTVRTFFRSIMQLTVKTQAKGINYVTQPARVLKSMASVIRKDDALYDWWKSGAAQSTYIAVENKYLDKELNKVAMNKKAKGYLKNYLKMTRKERSALNWYMAKTAAALPFRSLQAFNDTLDQALKLAEYEVVKKQTGDKQEAALASREADVDFKRFGRITRQANRWALFFNVSLQGPDNIARTFARNPVRTSLRAGVFMVLPTLLLYAINRDEEEYQELNSWEKDMNWLIPVGDGTYVKLPIPFEIGILFKTIPEKLFGEYLDSLKGEEKQSWDDFYKNTAQTMMPNLVPTVIDIANTYLYQKDSLSGRDILPMNLKNLPESEQYLDSTSETFKWIGKQLDKSPLVLQETFEAQFGQMGQFALWGAETLLGNAGIVDKPDTSGLKRTYTERYVTSSSNDGGTSSINTFYEKLNELEKDHRVNGVAYVPAEELKMYREAADDMKNLRKLREDMLYNRLKQPDGSSFTKDVKKDHIDTVNKALRDIARMAQGKEAMDMQNFYKALGMLEGYEAYLKDVEKQKREEAKRIKAEQGQN